MFPLCGRLASQMRHLTGVSLTGLQELFGQWVALPAEMDEGTRKRLFFPLADVLALCVSGVLRRLVV